MAWHGKQNIVTYAAVDGDADVAAAAAAVFVFDCTFFMQQRGSGVAAYGANVAATAAAAIDVITHFMLLL